MRKTMLSAVPIVAGLSVSVLAYAADTAGWSYSGDTGPANWSELSPEFAACASGRNQSPVDISGAWDTDLPALDADYAAAGRETVNNGHTVKIVYSGQNSLALEGGQYTLKQTHFHTPSEHTVDGEHYPMEAHLVHADDAGNLAVVAILFEEGDAQDALAGVVASVSTDVGDRITLDTGLDAGKLLPDETAYYRLNGSLTTPPCSEGVRWLVMKQPVEASRAQIDTLAEAIGDANNRPVQPIHARVLVE